MMDINKLVAAETMAPCDADAYLSELAPWNEELARQAAHEEGLELSEERMGVVCYLREHFAECGPEANARLLLRNLEDAYSERGGRKYLYQLFPRGPVTQASRLAGLPTPAGNLDLSFGSVH